jgi:hypothetical protein
MKKIIALSGTASTGKSSTITLFADLLQQRFPDAVVEELPCHNPKADVQLIVTIGDAVIGIEGQGDPNSRLFLDLCHDQSSLKRFLASNCNLIICATRTRGAGWNAVTDMHRHGYEIDRMWSHPEQIVGKRDSVNLNIAQQIMIKVEEFINRV